MSFARRGALARPETLALIMYVCGQLLAGWIFALCCEMRSAASAEDDFPWIDPAGISGTLVLIGGGDTPEAIRRECTRLTSDEEARIVAVSEQTQGAEILRGAIIEPRFAEQSSRERLIAAVTSTPARIGLGVADSTALIVRGRRLEAIGEGGVTVILAASAGRPLREIELKPGWRHDLTMLRRAAIERSLANFPPQIPPEPRLKSGSLVIVGGGSLSSEITGKFIELAGGVDSPIVILPIAGGETLPEDASGDARVLTRAGAKNVRSLRARTRAEVESPEFAAALKEARGVWFNGGRQWRFIDAYMGTQAEELFRDVLRRGGVIGGSSAGASIQSQYMPRGSPLGNTDMLADGYERGLRFLPGTAIDQHFTQRRRHGDMTALVQRYPQLLGIGIDEATALVVQGGAAKVIGRGRAHFYDYREGPPAGERDYTPVVSGQTYDLVRRKIAE